MSYGLSMEDKESLEKAKANGGVRFSKWVEVNGEWERAYNVNIDEALAELELIEQGKDNES